MPQMLSHDHDTVVQYQQLGEAVCQALTDEAIKLGYSMVQIPLISWQAIKFSLVTDPADGSKCLSGGWYNESGYLRGNFQINGNGSFFAEHDLVLPHPTDKRWYVEAVTAWGKADKIITEPKLLAAP